MQSQSKASVRALAVALILLSVIVAAICIGCAGAASQVDMFRNQNRSALASLSVGISRDSVVRIFGDDDLTVRWGALGDTETYTQPYRTETLAGTKGTLLVYFYYTDRKAADGAITDDELTPVVFDNDRLIGWGWSFLDSSIQKYEIRVR